MSTPTYSYSTDQSALPHEQSVMVSTHHQSFAGSSPLYTGPSSSAIPFPSNSTPFIPNALPYGMSMQPNAPVFVPAAAMAFPLHGQSTHQIQMNQMHSSQQFHTHPIYQQQPQYPQFPHAIPAHSAGSLPRFNYSNALPFYHPHDIDAFPVSSPTLPASHQHHNIHGSMAPSDKPKTQKSKQTKPSPHSASVSNAEKHSHRTSKGSQMTFTQQQTYGQHLSPMRQSSPPIVSHSAVPSASVSTPPPSAVDSSVPTPVPPVSEYISIGWLGTTDGSGGLDGMSESRDAAALLHRLCGKPVFNGSSFHHSAGFAESELKQSIAQSNTAMDVSAGSASSSVRGCISFLDSAFDPELTSENSHSSVSPALQLRVDTNNKLLHCMVSPSSTAATASTHSTGLSLSGTSLGLANRDWAVELAHTSFSELDRMSLAQVHTWLMDGISHSLRAALLMLLSCHYIILLCPTHQLPMELFHTLNRLHALKSRLLTAFTHSGNEPSDTNDKSPPPSIMSLTDVAPLYHALFTSLQLPLAERTLLSQCSNPLPLCFTPAVTLIIEPPRLIPSQNDAEVTSSVHPEIRAQLHTFTATITEQFRTVASKLKIIAAHHISKGSHRDTNSSPAAQSILDARIHFKGEITDIPAIPTASPSPSIGHAHSTSISGRALYEPIQLDGPAHTHTYANINAKHSSGSSDDTEQQQLIPPLFYLHTQLPVIVARLEDLFDTNSNMGDGTDRLHSSTALTTLRTSLERAVYVVRAQLDSLTSSVSAPAQVRSSTVPFLFSLSRILLAMQQLHSWIFNCGNNRSDISAHLCTSLDTEMQLHGSQGVDYAFSYMRSERAANTARKLYINAHAHQQAQQERALSASPSSGSDISSLSTDGFHKGTATSTPFYSAAIHEHRVKTCLALFHKLSGAICNTGSIHLGTEYNINHELMNGNVLALGPAVTHMESQLRQEMYDYWVGEHRGCDALSIFHHACILPYGHDTGSVSIQLGNDWPKAHAAGLHHSLRMSCHCGLSLLRLTKEPFSFSLIRPALTGDRCCQPEKSIGTALFGAQALSRGWNMWKYSIQYNPQQGLASIAGFYPSAARTCFLSSVRLTGGNQLGAGVAEIYIGLELECTLGHRYVTDMDDARTMEGAGSPALAATGFPRQESFIYSPCTICAYLRQLKGQASFDVNAEHKQKKLKQEEKRSRILLHKHEASDGNHTSSNLSTSTCMTGLSVPTVPSSTVRTHDRYAQIRHIWIVTPPTNVTQMAMQIAVKVISTCSNTSILHCLVWIVLLTRFAVHAPLLHIFPMFSFSLPVHPFHWVPFIRIYSLHLTNHPLMEVPHCPSLPLHPYYFHLHHSYLSNYHSCMHGMT
jgi:hypothetical protein